MADPAPVDDGPQDVTIEQAIRNDLAAIADRLAKLERDQAYLVTAAQWLVAKVETFANAAEAHPLAARLLRKGT